MSEYSSWWDYYDNGPGSEKMRRQYLEDRARYLKGRPVTIHFMSGSGSAESESTTDWKLLYDDQQDFIAEILNAVGASQGLALDRPMLVAKLRRIREQAKAWRHHVEDNGDLNEWEFGSK